MIRELAENPNVHQPVSPGRELVTDPAGRFSVYLGTGTGPHSATVQRVRLDPDEVVSAVAEIRSLLRAHGRGGAEWDIVLTWSRETLNIETRCKFYYVSSRHDL